MDADMNRIRSALFYLSPDMPRAEWVEIGMALKAGLGDCAAALRMCDGTSKSPSHPRSRGD
jgi:hypothetical protein